MRPDVDLVVQREGRRWVVRPFTAQTPGVTLLWSSRSKPVASAVAIALARHHFRLENSKRACEVFWRNSRNGRIMARNTYGRDPERTEG